MKYEPIVIEHAPTYKCPICGDTSECIENIKTCIRLHGGNIPEFVKIFRHDITGEDLYPDIKYSDTDMLYESMYDLISDDKWKERKNVDELESRLYKYIRGLDKRKEMVENILDKIHKYGYCGA